MTDKIKKADDFDRYRYGINSYVDGYKAGAAAVLTDIKNNGLDVITAAGLIKTYCKGSDCTGCPFFSIDTDCNLSAIPENWRLDHDE